MFQISPTAGLFCVHIYKNVLCVCYSYFVCVANAFDYLNESHNFCKEIYWCKCAVQEQVQVLYNLAVKRLTLWTMCD